MKKEERLDYQADVEIDPDQLDREWRKQASLMVKYGEAKAKAQHELDLAKEALELLCAQKDVDFRESYEGKKPTEAAIANMIMTDAEVQDARQALVEAKYRLGLMSAAVDGFQHRRAALENLVRLFGMQYYAEPFEDIEARGSLDDMTAAGAMNRVRKALQQSKGEEPVAERE